MDRTRMIVLGIAALALVFALGFFPQWSRAGSLEAELEQARHELTMARLEGRLGAALAESQRSNYERARQLMADFYPDLQDNLTRVENPADRRALQAILNQRDEVITLLSRAEPESTQRLMLLYTQYFEAIDPAAGTAPAVTPSPGG